MILSVALVRCREIFSFNRTWTFPLDPQDIGDSVPYSYDLSSLITTGKQYRLTIQIDNQWYSLVNDTPAICLDSAAFIEPIVEVVDHFNRARRLGHAFEVCAAIRQLFASTWRFYAPAAVGCVRTRFLLDQVVRYLRGDISLPSEKLNLGQIQGLFKLTNNLATTLE